MATGQRPRARLLLLRDRIEPVLGIGDEFDVAEQAAVQENQDRRHCLSHRPGSRPPRRDTVSGETSTGLVTADNA